MITTMGPILYMLTCKECDSKENLLFHLMHRLISDFTDLSHLKHGFDRLRMNLSELFLMSDLMFIRLIFKLHLLKMETI